MSAGALTRRVGAVALCGPPDRRRPPRTAQRAADLAPRIVGPAYILASCASLQTAAAIATTAFAALGPTGTGALRFLGGAVVLMAFVRPHLRGRSMAFWLITAALGAATARDEPLPLRGDCPHPARDRRHARLPWPARARVAGHPPPTRRRVGGRRRTRSRPAHRRSGDRLGARHRVRPRGGRERGGVDPHREAPRRAQRRARWPRALDHRRGSAHPAEGPVRRARGPRPGRPGDRRRRGRARHRDPLRPRVQRPANASASRPTASCSASARPLPASPACCCWANASTSPR
jgi:hypothetical protein